MDNELWKKVLDYWLGFVNVQPEELLKAYSKRGGAYNEKYYGAALRERHGKG